MTPEHPQKQTSLDYENSGDISKTSTETPLPAGSPQPSPKPPRGPSLRIIAVVAVAIVITLWMGSMVGSPVARGWNTLVHAFHGPSSMSTASSATTQYYTCGMHPWVILPTSGNCPICGMELVPLDPAKFTGQVTINPVIAQDIGIRVSPVISGPVVRNLRTVGTVDYDETRLRDVNIKIGGWIEKLHVDTLGQPVTKGQALFELYSPELYAAQEEYLLAWRNRDKSRDNLQSDAGQGDNGLVRSSRTKLEYFDITPQQIEDLQKRDTPAKTMTIQSPYEGVVIDKRATEGMKVDAGMQVYRIADLSKVWVMATLYEYQLPYVELGQSAVMSLSYLPGQTFQGKVIYIYPYLSDKTRQVQVRLEFDNPTGLLKPGMYATIDLHSTLANDRTLAPRSAVIDTGERKVAFVSLGEGRFEPRKVQTGADAQDGMVEILDGLKPGEKVVTSGQFLIDSEANVREALAKMIKGNLSVDQNPTVAAISNSELGTALPAAATQLLNGILRDYLSIQAKLSSDVIDGTAAPANEIANAVDALLKVNLPDDPHFWHKHDEVATVRGKALELAQAKSLEEVRLAFADMSVALDKLLLATGVPADFGSEVQELHCPMYRQGQGGTVWLQVAGDVRNPYFGTKMIGCFDRRTALPVTAPSKSVNPDVPTTQSGSSPVVPTTRADSAADARLTADQQMQVDALAQAYLKAHELLAKDQYQYVPALLKSIHETTLKLASSANPEMAAAAKQAASASDVNPQDLAEARVAYKQLSLPVIGVIKMAPPSSLVAPTLFQIHCPMTKGDWLQTDDKIANPYYGTAMPTCGEVVEKINIHATTTNGVAR